MADVADRRLYLCTADRPDLEDFLRRCIDGGVDVVQLREKDLDARSLMARGEAAREVCADAGVPFILNDRPDLALELGADGVHVGQDDASPTLARRILGPGAIVGYSTHTSGELKASEDEPADYVSVGPIEATPTKPGRPGTGLDYLRHAAGTARHPFFVTGGVTPSTLPEMMEAGGRRFVVVRYLTESDDPEGAARSLRKLIDTAWS